METYNGELQKFFCGEPTAGAIQNLVQYVEKNVDYSKCGSEEERNELKMSVGISLKNFNVQHSPRMVFDNFSIECLVGFGSFGRIWMATGEKDIGQVALKQLLVDVGSVRRVWKERDLLVYLKHPRICNLIGAFFENDVFFVMELCHGSVACLRNRISPKNAVRFAIQLLQALQWIHSKHVVHADVKPDNCLVNTGNNLVLSDFGSAFYIKQEGAVVEMPVSHGSPGYLDYDANKFLVFSTKTDIFSAAAVIFEMDIKRHLLMYASQEQTRELYIDAFENGRVNALPPNTTPNLTMRRQPLAERAMESKFGFLLQKMIADKKNRLSASEALQDPALRLVLMQEGVSVDNVDNGSAFVTREFNVDHSYSFSFFSEAYSPDMDLALLTFYYDEVDESSYKDERPIPTTNKRRRVNETATSSSESDSD